LKFQEVTQVAYAEIDRSQRRYEYIDNPVLWAREVLGMELWSRQAEVAMSVVNNRNTAVKAGHEVGKSMLAGLLICWWIDVHWDLPGGCFVVSTAPSTRQINAIVWREARKFHGLQKKRFELGLVDHAPVGYITADAHWRLPDGIELGYGAKPPDGSDDSMSGIHARYVLAVGDEAVGLSEKLIGDLANITSNATSRRLIIMNPTNPLSYAASIFKRKLESWNTITISCLESPNFTDGEGLPIEVLESLVDQSYVDGIIEEHGKDSPTYISRVLGEFAWDMGFTLIRPEDIAKGEDVEIVPSTETRPVLGVDFSRSKNGDKNTVYVYHDGRLRYVDAWNEPNAMRTAVRVHDLALQYGVSRVQGDGQGLGGPIMDRIADLSENRYATLSVDSNFTSPDIMKWYNWRAYSYWDVQDRLSKGLLDIDGEDEKLTEQLLGIEIKKRTTGRNNILLESKEEMRKRGVHSPDHADAAVLAASDLSWFFNQTPAGSVVAEDPADIPDFGLMAAIRGPGQPYF
jgi:hypothetical protein